LFSSLETTGSVSVAATFSSFNNSVSVVVTDSPLVEILIDPVTSVDVCLNLEFTAKGLLADGNEVPLTSDDLTWGTDANTSAIGEFKDGGASLSTYLVEEAFTVTATSIDYPTIDTSVDISILDTLVAIEITSKGDETELEEGDALDFTLTGEYVDGSLEDITGNSIFRSENSDVADFVDNQLPLTRNC